MLEAEQKLVLKRINEIRKDAGLGKILKLRRGIRSHDKACPIAMSLEGTVFRNATGFYAYTWRAEKDEQLASAINDIAQAFDNGEMPELELPKTPVKIRYPGDRKATIIS